MRKEKKRENFKEGLKGGRTPLKTLGWTCFLFAEKVEEKKKKSRRRREVVFVC